MRKSQVRNRLPLESGDGFDDGEKNLLADFVRILARKLRRELKNETPRRRVVFVEKRFPRFCVAPLATGDQLCFIRHRREEWAK